jgi:crossover junction endodeoxyribonuclease RuvC
MRSMLFQQVSGVEMICMGIDPSTKSGVVVLGHEGEVKLAVCIEFAKAKGFERLQLIAKSMKSLIEEWKPDVVVVEGFAFRNKFTLVLMVQVGTIVRQALYLAGISWYDVPPTQIKKWTTGSGSADKAKMAVFVEKRWGFVSKNDNIVDAYAMAQVARQIALSGAGDISGVNHEEPVVS